MRFLLIVVLASIFAASTLASEKEAAAIETVRAFAIAAPTPDYPYLARKENLTGAGAVILRVDKATGVVADVVMATSTGHAMLDDAALRAFREWRFKPGTVSTLRLPIRFVMPPPLYLIRRYRFVGTIRAVDLRAGTITIKPRGAIGTDRIIIDAETRLRKNGQAIGLRDIAVADEVEGRAAIRVPDTMIGEEITVKQRPP